MPCPYFKLATLTSSLITSALWIALFPVHAQTIIPDGTTPTTVQTTELNTTITHGAVGGTNLFHSFQRFGIPTGGSATFDLVNTPTITTIFSRVTGGSTSNIDGLIRTINSNSPVSLFLINPSGILFGSNASLNIGGSFVGTTANSIKFAHGEFASTATPLPTSLLTINVPVGLQMGHNSGNITVQNSGHQLRLAFPTAPLQFNSTPTGLAVAPGNALVLVGTNLTLESGILTAPGGRVELGAVQPDSGSAVVGVRMEGNRLALDYGTLREFGDIDLRQRSLVNISGIGNGAIHVQARNLLVQDGSALVWENRGSQSGSGITIRTTDTVQLLRRSTTGFASGVYGDAKGAGSTGSITIATKKLLLQQGAGINNRTFATAEGGDITIEATDVQLWSSISSSNTIASRALGSGQGGDVRINTQQLSVQGSGVIAANVNNASGSGGNILINATESVEFISGANGIVAQAFLSASAVGGTGAAGDITVNTGRLTLRNGAAISSSTYGNGNGGNVIVNAFESIEITGTVTSQVSGLQRSTIQASGILLPPASRLGFGLPAAVTGAAGNVIINTPQLQVSNGGEVSVRHDDRGNAGNLFINVDRLLLNTQGRITANTASGEGGGIALNLREQLLLRRGSFISTEAKGTGNGGNITIKAPVIAGFENSDIVANAVQGRGGNIQITTEGIFGLRFRPQLTPENDITASSQFGVSGTVRVNTIGVDPSAGLVELPVNLTDSSQQIVASCASVKDNQFVITGRGGIPDNPTQVIRHDRAWADTRDLSTFLSQAPAVSARPSTPPLITEATTWQRRPNGGIELVAIAPNNLSLTRSTTCTGASEAHQNFVNKPLD
jgi:filamentous hemagglutinin family protein